MYPWKILGRPDVEKILEYIPDLNNEDLLKIGNKCVRELKLRNQITEKELERAQKNA